MTVLVRAVCAASAGAKETCGIRVISLICQVATYHLACTPINLWHVRMLTSDKLYYY